MAESAQFSRRNYDGNAAPTTAVGGHSSSVTTINGVAFDTWDVTNGPGRATISNGTTEEEVEYTGVTATTLTGVTRGVGGTAAATWTGGETISHTSSQRDFDEANKAAHETVGKATAANQLLVSDGANSFAALDVAASRIVGRGAAGDVDDLDASAVKTILSLTDENIQDLVGAMVSGGTETNITVTYDDTNGRLDFVASSGSSPDQVFISAGQFETTGASNRAYLGGFEPFPAWMFDAAASEYIGAQIIIPTGWATVDIDLWWSNNGAGSGDVYWTHYAGPFADGATASVPAGDSDAITAPAQDVIKKSTVRTGLAVTAGALFAIVIARQGAQAGDTLANDAALIGVNIRKAS